MSLRRECTRLAGSGNAAQGSREKQSETSQGRSYTTEITCVQLDKPLSEMIADVLREIVEPLGAMAASARVAGLPGLPEEDRRDLLAALEERATEAAGRAQELYITIKADGSVEARVA